MQPGQVTLSYWVCHYHIIWATKGRAPLLTGAVESTVYDVINAKSQELGCPIDVINGISDHVHVAVRIKPTIAVGTWVAQVKGASSRAVNIGNGTEQFRWQEGYGVLTFGVTSLKLVTDYIRHQKEHHQSGHLEPYMERIEDAG